MNKILVSAAAVAAMLLAGTYVFKDQLKESALDLMLADMYLPEDNDDFDPGMLINNPFPDIKAIYDGREITRIDEFIKDKGMIFIANRSVDW